MSDVRDAGGGIDAEWEDGGRAPDALTCRLLCGALLGKGKVEAAQQAARRAVELDGADWRNYQALLLAILATRSLDVDLLAEARRVAVRARTLGSDQVAVHLAAALLASRTSDKQGVQECFDAAVRTDPRSPLIGQTEDRIRDRRNASAAAVAMYQATLDTAPADPAAASTVLAAEYENTVWGRLQSGYLLLFGSLAFPFVAGLVKDDSVRSDIALGGTACFIGCLVMVWRVGRKLRGMPSRRLGRMLWILLLILLPALRITLAVLVVEHNPIPAAIVVVLGAAGLAATFALAPRGTRIAA